MNERLGLSILAMVACAEVPPGAEEVTAEEYADLESRGTFVPYTPWDAVSQRAATAARLAEDRAVVEAFVAGRPALGRLLEPVSGAPTGEGNVVATRPDGEPVVLQGDAARTGTLANAIRTFGTQDNQAKLFAALDEALPGACREGRPALDEATALPEGALVTLNDEALACWDDWQRREGGPPRDTVPPPDGDAQLTNGEDASGVCDEPSSWTYTWFDHPWALSPVKDQARRGTCVAFGMVGAMEYAIARNFHRYVDLSEQGLYAYGKLDLRDGQHFGDGLDVPELAEFLEEEDAPVPFEGTWGYNPSWARQVCDGNQCPVDEDDGDRYRRSCQGYPGETCSDTTHQARLVSHDGSTAWWRPAAMGTAYERLEWIEIGGFDGGDITRAMALIDQGWGLVVSMDVTDDFLRGEANDPSGSVVGGHAMHIANVVRDPLADGGAWVLLRNSWGCSWGSEGYRSVSAAYVDEYVESIVALRPRKGAGNTPPEPRIEAPDSGDAFSFGGLANAIAFRGSALDLEDVNCCTLDWSSDRDGFMGRGEAIEHIFQNPGRHSITLTARDSEGARGESHIVVQVENQPPLVTIVAPTGTLTNPMVNQYVSFVGDAYDLSDPLGVPCTGYRWTSSDPADAFPRTGCDVAARFETPGVRTVTLEVSDTLGSAATADVQIDVRPFDPDADPTITIVNPASGNLLDPYAAEQLSATTTASGFFAVFWSIDVDGQSHPIGSGLTTTFRAADVLTSDCGSEAATLWAEVTQGTSSGGTTSIPVSLGWDPC
ncbi:MAG: PKD domain-containing protein [Myxococcota bacterium]